MNGQWVKVFATKKRVLVERVARVNKINYYVEVNDPEVVYTEKEIYKINS